MTGTPALVWLDTETTGLRPDRRAWEVALIYRAPGSTRDQEFAWYTNLADLDLGNADLAALKIGQFYERHPQMPGNPLQLNDPHKKADENEMLQDVEALTRGALVMGSNPSFDTETLAARMRAHGICPSWHYHSEDVPTLAKGWLYGTGRPLPATWKSDQISLACGVDPAKYERHGALGDCLWMRDLFDVVTGVSKPAEAAA